MQSYPYDWKGTNPTNAFKEDWIVEGENPEDRILILKHRPFFGLGLEVTAAGSTNPLTLGKDYQLAYQLPELDDSVASPVWCGVQIINPQIGGALQIKGQTLGDSFYSPFIDILDDVVKYLNNPVDVDWLKLTGRPTLMPPQPAATSWADLLNKKYLASAIRDVELDAGAVGDLIREKLEALKVVVEGVHAELVAFNYPAHISSHMAHDITVAQAGAHPANLKTPDTFLAYGKTLRTLTAEIRALGLQQSDIDNYIEKWACKDVNGVFVQTLAANRQLFKSKSGTSEVTFTDTAFTIKTNGSVILSAGYDVATTVRFMEWKSGVNTLRIESSGNALGMDKLTLNGKVLLTTNLLLEYQSDGNNGGNTDPDDNKLYVQGRNGITFTGKGSRLDPVKGTLTPPNASPTVKGIAKLKTGPGPETDMASTPASLTPYEGKAGGYVPKTTMINSGAMNTGTRTLTKADVGLSNVDNTKDIDKPISRVQQVELDLLSAKDHKHTWDELLIPLASSAQKGVARYTALEDGLAAQKGVAPSLLKELSDRLDIIAEAVLNVKPGISTDFAAINSSTWTVTGTKRGLSVKDLDYFYLSHGEKKSGIVSGTVDLQTTPMFRWFSPYNTMERTWPDAVSTGNLEWDGISQRPPLALQAVPVGNRAGQMGNLSVISLLAKERVVSLTGKLDIYVAAGGKVVIYVDGIEKLSANSPAYVRVPLERDDGTAKTVAIRADCSDAAKPAALMYEIWDGNVPLARSDIGKPIAKLQEFVVQPEGLRHYLYMNMLTGSLYSRAEPVESQDIDIEHALIGYVDLPTGGFTATSVAFPKTFDFGMAKEISDHAARTDAHSPSLRDWSLSDNAKMLPMGRTRFETGVYVAGGNTYIVANDKFLLLTDRMANVTEPTMALWEAKGQSPIRWMTPYNPKANGHTTIEGGFVVDIRRYGEPAIADDVELVFASNGEGRTSAMKYRRNFAMRFAVDGTNKPKVGYLKTAAVSTAIQTYPTWETVTAPCTMTILRDEYNTTSPEALDLPEMVGRHPRVAFRYRYDCKTRELRVFKATYTAGSAGIHIVETLVAFDFEFHHYLSGFVGITRGASGKNPESCAMVPTLMPMDSIGFDDSNYHYYRSLFESYVDTNVVTTGSNNTTFNMITGFYPENHIATEWISLPGDSGAPQKSHDGYLPTAFWKGSQNVGSPIKTDGRAWFAPWSANGAPTHISPITAQYKIAPDVKVAKVTLKISSSYPGNLRIGSYGSGVPSFGASSSASDIRTVSCGPGWEKVHTGLSVFLEFLPPAVGSQLKLAFTMEVYDTNGTLMQTITEAVAPVALLNTGRRFMMDKRNPYHMTEKMWEWLLDRMDAERQADGTDFGGWA